MTVCLFSACSITKNVPADDKLFNGSTVTSAPGKIDKSIKRDLKKITKPIPNSSLLGIKFRLILFNAIKEPKKQKGFLYTMKHKWGQAPVLLSTAKPKATEARFNDNLFSKGFLKSGVKSEIIIKGNKASIKYTVSG